MHNFIKQSISLMSFLTLLLVAVMSTVQASARGASSSDNVVILRSVVNPDSISPVVLLEGSVPVTWSNDDTYPWRLDVPDKSIYNGISLHGKNTTSWISFSYTSAYQTEVSFSWKNINNSGSHYLYLYVDGVYTSSINTSSYTKERFYLPKGEHLISFRDSIGNSTNSSQFSNIKNIKVSEIKALETVVLASGSKPLTFTNDATWPWVTYDGYIQNSNAGKAQTNSKFSTTFTTTKPSVIKYYVEIDNYNNSTSSSYSYHRHKSIVDGNVWANTTAYTSGSTYSRVLEPGTHTIEWSDSVFNTTSSYPSRIKNIMLHDNWVEVELATPGSLGVEVLYKVDVLTDVELLKVTGTLNSTDWATIKQMKNLKGLDLSDAHFDAVPESAFSGNTVLYYLTLPEGVKTIGNNAFSSSRIIKLTIPSTVTSIGENAFYERSYLQEITFNSDSQLKTIGQKAFYGCTNLKEFIMPNTVMSLGSYAFYGCNSLNKIIFSNSITSIPERTCYECYNLSQVVLPQNVKSIGSYAFYRTIKLKHVDFPSSLSSINSYAFAQNSNDNSPGLDSLLLPITLSSLGEYAFQYNKCLRYIELPSYIGSYYYNFYGCTAVEKVVCRSATPPGVSYDPFSNGRAKNAITLVVPSFAVVTYKLDSYWYQFGNIIEGDDVDYWKITGPLLLTNNRRMQGTPDIDLYYGGQLTVSGNAPMPVGQLNYFAGSSGYGRLLNSCPTMTIEGLTTKFSAAKETWYFICPIHDVDLTKVQHSVEGASFVFRYYNAESRATNGTGNSWQNVANGKLEAGKGYIFRTNTAGTMTLPADANGITRFVNIEDVNLQLEAHQSSNSANKNWNYVGNPYPCYYDIYYLDFSAPITVWTGSTYKAYSIADDNLALAPMAGFFVQKPDAVDKIIFHKEGRQVESSPNHANMAPRIKRPQSDNQDRFIFDIAIKTDDVADETRIVINENASTGYELERDVSKFMSMNTEVPQIYTIDNEQTKLAINERPLNDSIVNMGMFIGLSGEYTISALRHHGEILLIDLYTNTTTQLDKTSYTFTSGITGYINDRFVLKFNMTGTSGINNINKDVEIAVKNIKGGVNIQAPNATIAYIYTLDGKLISCQDVCGNSNIIELPSGIYLVKVGGKTIKTIVQ